MVSLKLLDIVRNISIEFHQDLIDGVIPLVVLLSLLWSFESPVGFQIKNNQVWRAIASLF
jgi:hypothetical protein